MDCEEERLYSIDGFNESRGWCWCRGDPLGRQSSNLSLVLNAQISEQSQLSMDIHAR